MGGNGGGAGLSFTIFGDVNFTCSGSIGGCGGTGGVGGISFISLGGSGGTVLLDFVFCAIICVEIVHTISRSIIFFINKFLIRHTCIIIPQKNPVIF